MVLNSPRGTSDILGVDIKYRDFIINSSRELFRLFNYSEIITPAFEHTEIFDRGIGENTDIVRKEMYTFTDKKGRSLTLRPEGTASVVRAIIEHKLYLEKFALKLFYIGNMFRYERPQKGRMREFWQIGVEAAGVSEPLIDAEVIWLLSSIFERLGFKNLKLLINSVGCLECRNEYIKVFKSNIKPRIESLCPDCRTRYEKNPLRIFDCKVQECMSVISGSPKIYNYICSACKEHILKVCSLLELLQINYVIKEELVRGFDYYTRTIFEIISEELQSVQNALGGGGRYDNLISQFGGPQIPSIGFAIGIDRTALLMKQLNIRYAESEFSPSVLVILLSGQYQSFALKIMQLFREQNITCDISYEIKAIGSQIKAAEKNGYSHITVIGEDELETGLLTVKDLKNFAQFKFDWKNEKYKISDIFRSNNK